MKLFHSLKIEIKVKPVWMWTEDPIYGVILVGFIAVLMIGLTRHFVEPVKRISTKFIIASSQNLTETVVSMENGKKRKFYSNFDPVNRSILAEHLCPTWRKLPENGCIEEFEVSKNQLSNSKTSENSVNQPSSSGNIL